MQIVMIEACFDWALTDVSVLRDGLKYLFSSHVDIRKQENSHGDQFELCYVAICWFVDALKGMVHISTSTKYFKDLFS